MKDFHSRDLRKGRRSEPGRAYLVTVTTCQRRRIFLDLYPARCVIRQMRYLHTHGYVESLCFVVMPDHLHWLFILGDRLSLSKTIEQLKSWTSRSLHENDFPDEVWQRGFHDRAIRRKEDIRKIARYIVANPLRAGLVEQIGSYPFWDACWLAFD